MFFYPQGILGFSYALVFVHLSLSINELASEMYLCLSLREVYVGRTTGADCPDQCCPLDHSLYIIHKYASRSTDRSFVLKHKLFGYLQLYQ